MRKANIDKMLQMLSKEQCAKAYEVSIDYACMAFRLPTTTVSSLDGFIEVCAQFCAHCAKQITPTAAPTPKWSRDAAIRIIEEHFPGGMAAAYAISDEGKDGGLRSVLNAISDALLDRRAEEYFQYVLHECVDTMDPDDVLELTTQFVDRCGDMLGHEKESPSPASLIPYYAQLIRTYAEAVASVECALGAASSPAHKGTSPRSPLLPTNGELT